MSRTRGSTENEVKIKKLYAITYRSFGYSITEIASKLGVTRRTVFYYLKDYPGVLSQDEVMAELNRYEQEWQKKRIEKIRQDKRIYKGLDLIDYLNPNMSDD